MHIYNVKFPHRTFHGERKLTLHDEFFSLLLNLGPVPKKLISGKITYI